MTGVKFNIEGSEAVSELLRAAKARLKDTEPLFNEIGLALVTSTGFRFEQERDPDGNPWPQSLRAMFTSGKTLTDTALLVNSITYEASDDSVAVGTNLIYAAIHQFGGTIKSKTKSGLWFRTVGNGDWARAKSVEIPQRSFLGLSDDDEDTIQDITEAYLNRLIGAADN
jgi:phage virion morphogenesis protein